jgi:hypothetical protein
LVAVTMQVPALAALSESPTTEQPVAVPLTTLKLTVPVPDPPEVTSVSAVSAVPLVEVISRVD